jgi:hypothetical protein
MLSRRETVQIPVRGDNSPLFYNGGMIASYMSKVRATGNLTQNTCRMHWEPFGYISAQTSLFLLTQGWFDEKRDPDAWASVTFTLRRFHFMSKSNLGPTNLSIIGYSWVIGSYFSAWTWTDSAVGIHWWIRFNHQMGVVALAGSQISKWHFCCISFCLFWHLSYHTDSRTSDQYGI